MLTATLASAQDQYSQDRPARLAAVINDTVLADSKKYDVVVKAMREFAVLPDTPEGKAIAEANIKSDVLEEKLTKSETKGVAQYSYRKAYGKSDDVPEDIQEADRAQFEKTLIEGGLKTNEFRVIRYKGELLDYFPELEDVPSKEIITVDEKEIEK